MSYRPAPPVDSVSLVQAAIEFDHAKIHSGQSFIAWGTQSLSSATYNWGWTTPASPTRWHMVIYADFSGEADLDFVESPGTYSGGSAWTAYNLDRDSVTAHGGTLLQGVSYTGGTILDSYTGGDTGDFGAGMDGRHEWILKPSTVYVLKVTTTGTGVEVTIKIEWYLGGPLP